VEERRENEEEAAFSGERGEGKGEAGELEERRTGGLGKLNELEFVDDVRAREVAATEGGEEEARGMSEESEGSAGSYGDDT
jgi:hypothetical protein